MDIVASAKPTSRLHRMHVARNSNYVVLCSVIVICSHAGRKLSNSRFLQNGPALNYGKGCLEHLIHCDFVLKEAVYFSNTNFVMCILMAQK